MTKKEKIPDLKFEGLKVGQAYRGKNPKMIGIFGPLVDDRQILHISQFKKPVGNIDHGYTKEYDEWFSKKGSILFKSSENTQIEFEKETDKPAKNIETVWDYMVQYNSPSVKFGKHYPSIPASKFIKWAAKNVTDILPENGDWASTL